jgi:hypothetical protein
MDYPTNPFKFSIGNKDLEFLYDHDDSAELFHVRLPEKGVVMFNVLMWANDEDHVYQIIKDAAKFARMCHMIYQENVGQEWHLNRAENWELFWEKANTRDFEVKKAPKMRAFKVAWASNDTI